MRFAPTTFKPAFGRVLSVVVAAISVLGLGTFVVSGDWTGLIRYGWGLILLAAAAFAVFWLPALDVAESAVTVRNVFSTVSVPWSAIERLDTKYALTLYTAAGKVTSWASPAPSRYASQVSMTADTRLAARDNGGSIRPGDLLDTASGAGAFVIRAHLEQLREDGRLGTVEPVGRRLHVRTIVALAALAVAMAVGILMP